MGSAARPRHDGGIASGPLRRKPTMKLLLCTTHPGPMICAGTRPLAAAPRALPAPDAAIERPRGCGWYDSSHELQSGLRVTEHADLDAIAHQIPSAWQHRRAP